MGNAPWRRHSAPGWGFEDRVGDLELQGAREHVPRLIVLVMDMERSDPLPIPAARISPFDNHEIVVRATKLATRERIDESIDGHRQ
jgi:hypothetical protein